MIFERSGEILSTTIIDPFLIRRKNKMAGRKA
jgi:hypothetical protein